MEALMIISMLIAFSGYFASIALGIVLLVKLIHMGIACIKLGKFYSKDRIRLADRHLINVLWGWVLALSIFFALVFSLFFITIEGDAFFSIVGFVAPILYLNPQIAVLVAGKIIMGKYTRAAAAYRAWARREKALSALPETGGES